MTFPENILYTKDHEWIQAEGGDGTVGITDYAQGELGDVVFVELPKIGRQVKQGESFGTIEAVKAVSDLFAPASGEIVAVNNQLEKLPETVNRDPYATGWIVKLRLKDPAELKTLLDSKRYRELIGK
jgi:glycine cleavage system H protein